MTKQSDTDRQSGPSTDRGPTLADSARAIRTSDRLKVKEGVAAYRLACGTMVVSIRWPARTKTIFAGAPGLNTSSA